MTVTAPPAPQNRTKSFVLVLTAIFVVLMTPAVLVVVTRAKPFEPLVLKTQTVENRLPDIDGPAAHVGDELVVNATKCNLSGQSVGISNQSSWVSVNPAGSVIAIGTGTAYRPAKPQCQDFHYRNPMPQAVQARMRELFAQGVTRQEWRLTGLETPLAPHAVASPWTTETIVIVADGP